MPKNKTTKSPQRSSVRSTRNVKPLRYRSESLSELKYKQLPISTFCIIRNNKSTHKFTECESQLHPETIEQNGNKTSKNVVKLNKVVNKPELKTTTTDTTNLGDSNASHEKRSKPAFKRNTSGSFDKYGVHLPKLEDVLEYQKTADQNKRMIENLMQAISAPLEDVKVALTEPERPQVILDCKHLTNEDISKLFLANMKHIEGIIHSKIYSKRHELFKKQNYNDSCTINDLKYNTSMITFTFEQKKELLRCLRKQFGKEELCKNDQYFFKVLLPELCLKIFMDVHDMSKEVAVHYLEERPVDIIT